MEQSEDTSFEPFQSAMARAALGWSFTELARQSGVGRSSCIRFEQGYQLKSSNVAKLRTTFESRGIVFFQKDNLQGVLVTNP